MDNIIVLDSDWSRNEHVSQCRSMGHEERYVRARMIFPHSKKRASSKLVPAKCEHRRVEPEFLLVAIL
jgi:hypothetical protein